MRKKPIIPKMVPIGAKFYIYHDKETGQSYLTEAQEDGSEKFYQWLPPPFSQCIEERIKAGKFGKVKTYRL